MCGAAGVLGAAVVGAGCLIAALPYRGREGEAYSPLNHFVSELGEVGVSTHAAFFNGGLLIGGALITVFMAGLAGLDRHWLMRGAAVSGVLSGVFAFLVGVFPMNQLAPHLVVAMAFFHLGLVTIGLFSAHVLRVPRLPRWLFWVGLPPFLAFAALLLLMRVSPFDPRDLPLDFRRPDVWPLPLVEWIVAFSTLVWIGVVGTFMAAGTRSQPPPGQVPP